ncbi:MAG: hypothetical protein NBV63_02225 [Candidatus Pacebacteria bacterium]|nr:hypothetical protein [Candidatus Paceibacterota bacterium]
MSILNLLNDKWQYYFGDEPIPVAIRSAYNAALIRELQELGVGVTEMPDAMRREMLVTGGIDVRNADGSWSRWEVKFNPNGTVADITKTTKPPLGTGWFITEDPGRRFDATHTLVPPNEPLETDAARTRDESALPPYNETEVQLRKSGALPVGESKPGVWDKQVPRLIKQPAELPHIVLDKPEAYIEEVKRTGGYTDNNGRTWKLWVHPTHGPFWVIDADGDPRVPKLGDVDSKDLKAVRTWTPGVESPSGKKS